MLQNSIRCLRTYKLLRKSSESVMSYQQIDTPQPFSPVDTPAPAASPPTTTASQQEHQPLPPPQSAAAVEHLPSLQSVLFWTTAVNHLKVLFRTTQIFPKQLISCCSKKNPNKKQYTAPHQPHLSQTHKNNK